MTARAWPPRATLTPIARRPNRRHRDGPDWRDGARCAEVDPELFFPEQGEPNAAAKAVCAGCEVREKCLDWALANYQEFGVWGALSEHERRNLNRSAA